MGLLAATSCGDVSNLRNVQLALVDSLKLLPPGIELRNSRVLLLTLEDHTFQNSTSLQREREARAIVEFVTRHLERPDRIKQVVVGFVAIESSLGVTRRTLYDVMVWDTSTLTLTERKETSSNRGSRP